MTSVDLWRITREGRPWRVRPTNETRWVETHIHPAERRHGAFQKHTPQATCWSYTQWAKALLDYSTAPRRIMGKTWFPTLEWEESLAVSSVSHQCGDAREVCEPLPVYFKAQDRTCPVKRDCQGAVNTSCQEESTSLILKQQHSDVFFPAAELLWLQLNRNYYNMSEKYNKNIFNQYHYQLKTACSVLLCP